LTPISLPNSQISGLERQKQILMNIVLRNDISMDRLSKLNCVQENFQELDVSKDQNRKVLIDLLKLKGNDVCVDCGAKGNIETLPK